MKKSTIYLLIGGSLLPFIFTTWLGVILFIKGINLIYDGK